MGKFKIVVNIIIIIFIVFSFLLSISIVTYKKPEKAPKFIQPLLTKRVENYRPLVEKYAEEYDVIEYVDILLAMMMQESGGKGNDPMQASESLCGKRNCIDDPEQSIKQGVYYFSQTIQAADGDLKLAIQSYNFGKGFINYVKSKNTTYTEQLAIEFSQKMYDDAEDKSIYTCLRKEAKKYDACYGDIYYVRDVLSYRKMFVLN